jgi:hypothetical protein
MPVDNAVKNADNWELAHNPVYRTLQQKLNERTAERDALRYACQTLLTLICIPHACCGRTGYLEVVRSVGPDIFDDVPDRFNIRGLIAQEQQIQKQLENL